MEACPGPSPRGSHTRGQGPPRAEGTGSQRVRVRGARAGWGLSPLGRELRSLGAGRLGPRPNRKVGGRLGSGLISADPRQLGGSSLCCAQLTGEPEGAVCPPGVGLAFPPSVKGGDSEWPVAPGCTHSCFTRGCSPGGPGGEGGGEDTRGGRAAGQACHGSRGCRWLVWKESACGPLAWVPVNTWQHPASRDLGPGLCLRVR